MDENIHIYTHLIAVLAKVGLFSLCELVLVALIHNLKQISGKDIKLF